MPAAHVRILTPLAAGAIAVIQVAGPRALPIVQAVFRPRSGKMLGEYPPNRLAYGDFLDGDGTVLDDGLALRGTDADGAPWAEFHMHGGVRIVQRLIRRLTDLGAHLEHHGMSQSTEGASGERLGTSTPAKGAGVAPGVQAPCVAGGRLPGAPGGMAANNAAMAPGAGVALGGSPPVGAPAALAGKLPVAPNQTAFLIQSLGGPADRAFGWLCPLDRWVQTCLAEAETVRVVQWLVGQGAAWRHIVADWRLRVSAGDADSVRLEAENLLSRVAIGGLWRGRTLAIIGSPNAGKSSIANRLAGQNVSLVATSPGTTRDWVGQRIALGGWPVLLVDTAGLRVTDDPVEAEGVLRAVTQARNADLRLFVIDRSCPPSDSESWLVRLVGLKSTDTIAYAKCDLPVGRHQDDGSAALASNIRTVQVSSLTGAGWSELERVLQEGLGFSALQDLQPLVFCGEVHAVVARLASAMGARERNQTLTVLDDLVPAD